jgi:integrase
MSRQAAGLSAAKVRTAAPGRYGDGDGLYLLVRSAEARSWLFRYTRDGRMREMGLGPASGKDAVPLADQPRRDDRPFIEGARTKARRLHAAVREGRDPLADRDTADAAKKAAAQQAVVRATTFRQVADAYIAAHEGSWRNAKHRQQWGNTLSTYAHPTMGDTPVADVDTSLVMAVLEPIWREKPETASRLRGRIEVILDYAKARDWRTGENPARWRGHVGNMLPNRNKVARVAHHPALDWRDIGAFVITLRAQDGLSARALELTILTAARTSEVLNARWPEIDLDRAVWVVPADRMKAGREHRVPLSPAAAALLQVLIPLRNEDRGDWVFPGGRVNRPLSNMSMLMLLRRMNRGDLTAHGFRSTFRDWAAETGQPADIAESALAHTLGNKVAAAYQRGDLLERRRKLMTAWAEFCGA